MRRSFVALSTLVAIAAGASAGDMPTPAPVTFPARRCEQEALDALRERQGQINRARADLDAAQKALEESWGADMADVGERLHVDPRRLRYDFSAHAFSLAPEPPKEVAPIKSDTPGTK